MKNFYPRLIIPLVCIFTIAQPLPAQTPEAKPKQFIYVLRLVPRLYLRFGLDAGRQDGALAALRTIQTRDRNG